MQSADAVDRLRQEVSGRRLAWRPSRTGCLRNGRLSFDGRRRLVGLESVADHRKLMPPFGGAPWNTNPWLRGGCARSTAVGAARMPPDRRVKPKPAYFEMPII